MILQIDGSLASYTIIVIEKFNVKTVYAIYPMANTSRHYGRRK